MIELKPSVAEVKVAGTGAYEMKSAMRPNMMGCRLVADQSGSE